MRGGFLSVHTPLHYHKRLREYLRIRRTTWRSRRKESYKFLISISHWGIFCHRDLASAFVSLQGPICYPLFLPEVAVESSLQDTKMASRFAERQNEYFIPGDGISREVIQADICRYLGNDALVRPGTHNVRLPCSPAVLDQARIGFNELTWDKQGRTGYFIRAYRNLTTVSVVVFAFPLSWCPFGNLH